MSQQIIINGTKQNKKCANNEDENSPSPDSHGYYLRLLESNNPFNLSPAETDLTVAESFSFPFEVPVDLFSFSTPGPLLRVGATGVTGSVELLPVDTEEIRAPGAVELAALHSSFEYLVKESPSAAVSTGAADFIVPG